MILLYTILVISLLANAAFGAYIIIQRQRVSSAPPAPTLEDIRNQIVAVIAGVQTQLDLLTNVPAQITALIAMTEPGGASAQDVSDTVAAVTATTTAITTAIAAAPPPPAQ